MSGLTARLEAILRDAPSLMRVLETARDLDLPDWLVVSGAVYQRVFNHLTGRDPDYGIKDYDLGYFDAADTSYEAEDVVIRRVAAAFAPPLQGLVEVRNQARVHLWFEGKFGEAYAPLTCSAEALERFVAILHEETDTGPLRAHAVLPAPMRTALRRQAYFGEDIMLRPSPDATAAAIIYLLSSQAAAARGAVLDLRVD